MFVDGYKRDLTPDDLWNLPLTETSDYNAERFEFEWQPKARAYIDSLNQYNRLLNSAKQDINQSEPSHLKNLSGLPKKPQKPSLGGTLARVYYGKFIAGAFNKLLNDLINFIGPIFLRLLIGFINDQDQSLTVGVFLTLILFISFSIQSVLQNQYLERYK